MKCLAILSKINFEGKSLLEIKRHFTVLMKEMDRRKKNVDDYILFMERRKRVSFHHQDRLVQKQV